MFAPFLLLLACHSLANYSLPQLKHTLLWFFAYLSIITFANLSSFFLVLSENRKIAIVRLLRVIFCLFFIVNTCNFFFCNNMYLRMSCYLFRLFIDCVLHHVLQKHVAMDFSPNPSNGFPAFPTPPAYGICFAAGDLSCISWSVVTVGSRNKIIIRVYRKRKKEKTHSKHAAWLLLGRSAAIFSFAFPLLSSVWCVALFSLMLYQQYESFRRTLPEKRVDKKNGCKRGQRKQQQKET